MRQSLILRSISRGPKYRYSAHRKSKPLYGPPSDPKNVTNKLHPTKPDLELPITPADVLRTALCVPPVKTIALKDAYFLRNKANFLRAVSQLAHKRIFPDSPGITAEESTSSTIFANAAHNSRNSFQQGRLLQVYELAVENGENPSTLLLIQKQLLWSVFECDEGFKPSAMLRTINAITGNLKRKRFRISAHHCLLGLQWAARAQSIDAFYRHLKLYISAMTRAYISTSDWISLMLQLMEGLHRKPEVLIAQFRPGATYRRDLYRIITGLDPTNAAKERDVIGMHALLRRKDLEMYGVYLSCLAELGAVEDIWSEWELLKKQDQLVSRLQHHNFPEKLTVKFYERQRAIAFYLYLAGEEKLALEVWADGTERLWAHPIAKSRMEINLLLFMTKGSKNGAVAAWRKAIKEQLAPAGQRPLRMMLKALGAEEGV
ncbi:MAG: hypothetical protein M1829_005718 [Trizodia sp. TS-e1964]|nr:MAG: hypothetical protein M1829_005718 [Trizodia sp. TS-e1964]